MKDFNIFRQKSPFNRWEDGFVTNDLKGQESAYRVAAKELGVSIEIKVATDCDGRPLPDCFSVWRNNPTDMTVKDSQIFDRVNELLIASGAIKEDGYLEQEELKILQKKYQKE